MESLGTGNLFPVFRGNDFSNFIIIKWKYFDGANFDEKKRQITFYSKMDCTRNFKWSSMLRRECPIHAGILD